MLMSLSARHLAHAHAVKEEKKEEEERFDNDDDNDDGNDNDTHLIKNYGTEEEKCQQSL